jgi:ferric enterobactin receptor
LKHTLFLASAVIAVSASAAQAQQSPPVQPAETAVQEDEPDDSDEIVVLAERGDEVRIDRRTYALRDDPVAQSTNMFDVLGRIPSVSVAPSGEITLLGASNVTIQINGQPVPGSNLEQVLRGLPGGDVERIEVISNPSAQYSAQASGGIINIVTRNRFDSGFGGTLQASADNMDGYHVGVGPSWSQDRWSLSVQTGAYGGTQNSDLDRVREEIPSGDTTNEVGLREAAWDGWYVSGLRAAYQADPRRRASLSFDIGRHNFELVQGSDISDDLGPVAARTVTAANTSDSNQLTFDFQQDGDQPREQARFNATLGRATRIAENAYLTEPDVGALSHYTTHSDQTTDTFSTKLDVDHPLAGEDLLTFGGAFDISEQTIENDLVAVAGPTPLPFLSRLEGRQQTLAAYGTLQFDVGDWTFLPGARGEVYRREVVSGGVETDDTDTRVFPSLHIRRALTPSINMDVSYTSRIQHPGFQQLDPARRYVDVNRALSGNPNLEPTTTDAYEINLTYQRGGANFSVTAFDRISQDIISQITELDGDVTLTTLVNAGESEQRGVQAQLRGPVGDHWRYSLTANALSRAFNFLDNGAIIRREELEYDGVAQLDYRDADQDAIGANQFQLELRFQGPRHGIQTVNDEFVMANFTWRRKLAERLTGVLTATDIFATADQTNEVTTSNYFERTEYASPGARIRLALTYQFGNGPQRPPQDQPPTPGSSQF